MSSVLDDRDREVALGGTEFVKIVDVFTVDSGVVIDDAIDLAAG